MKKLLFIFFMLSELSSLFGQTISISAEPNSPGVSVTRNISNNGKFPVSSDKKNFKTFSLQYSAIANGDKLIIEIAGTSIVGAASNAEYAFAERSALKTFTFQDDITNKEIVVKEDNAGTLIELLKFKFIKTAGKNLTKIKLDGSTTQTIEPLADFLSRLLDKGYELTPMGWVRIEESGMKEKGKRMQANTTHIFFDEFGNSLAGAIPQGISNRQYVVHIIYRGFSDHQREERYSVKQKSGSFSSLLNINNSGSIGKLPKGYLSGDQEDTFDQWKEEIFPLGIATDDITFDITVTTKTDEDGKPVKIVLETQTIKMSPVFHASIDVGLINSQLQNSTFNLVDAPDGSANKVIKETDKSPKGIVTVMTTFYTSPIVIIEKLLEKKTKKRIPSYKLTGRSYFDDHSFFERIYPTIGVSISSKSFENLFFGLNWELARGLSIFGGAHWGKVNVFEKPALISTTENIPVTKAQFDFYQNTKWNIDWAYGLKLDISIVTNLFKSN